MVEPALEAARVELVAEMLHAVREERGAAL